MTIRRINERNFVELFDAAQVMWFFYTRAEDMPRLKVEHFKFTKNEKGEEIVSLVWIKQKAIETWYLLNHLDQLP